MPVCALSTDPREFAFTCDTAKWIGKDAAIVVLKREADSRLRALAPYFTQIDEGHEFSVGRAGRAEQTFVLARGRALTRPYAFPYGPYRDQASN
jgi:LmbE family N-acetylglucosaminyl deacetylase